MVVVANVSGAPVYDRILVVGSRRGPARAGVRAAPPRRRGRRSTAREARALFPPSVDVIS